MEKKSGSPSSDPPKMPEKLPGHKSDGTGKAKSLALQRQQPQQGEQPKPTAATTPAGTSTSPPSKSQAALASTSSKNSSPSSSGHTAKSPQSKTSDKQLTEATTPTSGAGTKSVCSGVAPAASPLSNADSNATGDREVKVEDHSGTDEFQSTVEITVVLPEEQTVVPISKSSPPDTPNPSGMQQSESGSRKSSEMAALARKQSQAAGTPSKTTPTSGGVSGTPKSPTAKGISAKNASARPSTSQSKPLNLRKLASKSPSSAKSVQTGGNIGARMSASSASLSGSKGGKSDSFKLQLMSDVGNETGEDGGQRSTAEITMVEPEQPAPGDPRPSNAASNATGTSGNANLEIVDEKKEKTVTCATLIADCAKCTGHAIGSFFRGLWNGLTQSQPAAAAAAAAPTTAAAASPTINITAIGNLSPGAGGTGSTVVGQAKSKCDHEKPKTKKDDSDPKPKQD